MVALKTKIGFMVFFFRSENRKPFENRKLVFFASDFGTTMAGKTAKKHPEPQLGLISVDLALRERKKQKKDFARVSHAQHRLEVLVSDTTVFCNLSTRFLAY